MAPAPLLSHSGHDCFYLQFSKIQEKAGVKRKGEKAKWLKGGDEFGGMELKC